MSEKQTQQLPLPDGYRLGEMIRKRFEQIEQKDTQHDEKHAEFETALTEIITDLGGKAPQ